MPILDSLLLCLTALFYPAAWAAGAIQVAQAEPSAAPAAQPPAPEAPAPDAAEDELANTPARAVELQDVMEEVAELRAQVLRMQQTLDTWMATSLADLKAENEALRRELRDLYKNAGVDVPPVPAPDGDLLRDVAAQPEPEGPEPEAAPPPDPEVVKAVAAGGYFSVAEWGASPDDAAKSNPPRASLKGLIAVVLPETPDDELRALGRRLRLEGDAYDNINIEIFDDRAAAEAFKSGQPVDSARRVLSVSRHKASGRDVILLLKGESAVVVPPED
ncbi:MAG TPA: hypothetical protein VMZ06_00495 [Candidatus Bathyarchaeia archaeon]|nr:hypothetical protein [Candidatus Bathyarchaeia archaeon]